MANSTEKAQRLTTPAPSRRLSEPLPFGVVAFTEFPTGVLEPERDVCDAFVLSLAALFNDFKDVQFHMDLLDSNRPDQITRHPFDGEWLGMRLRTRRLTYSIVHELIESVQRA